MVLIRNHELYEWAESTWNSTGPLTEENVKNYGGYAVAPKNLVDKATAAMEAWSNASADIDEWLDGRKK